MARFRGFPALSVLISITLLLARATAQIPDPCAGYDHPPTGTGLLNGRNDFPPGFVFGTATSAYQEDIQRMKYMNVDAYRLSISWSRVIPCIEPYVTIWHWDTPQALEAEYGGFLSSNIVKDFEDYCDLLFEEYGKKVTKWITLNEPVTYVMRGYDEGLMAPGRCSVYMDPITYGRYPQNMVDLVGTRLPTFNDEDSASLRGSYDFLGLNYYTAYYSMNNPAFDPEHLEYLKDSHAITTATGADGKLIGPQLGSSWQYLYPQGLQYLLNYTKDEYRNPHIYITENGLSQEDDPTQTIEEATQDDTRIQFYDSHLDSVLQSMTGYNVNVSGFFAWSFADNYEWNDGYSVRFGFYYIDYTDGHLTRYPKSSACWYTNFLNRNAPTGQTLIRQKVHSSKLQARPTAHRSAAALGGRRALPARRFSRW
ncbi:unnamed protein product [Linum tenue]|uniref:Uncharacterized protein n=1 Tax=Linum tenue TaxID=586396 RepID=A0AAV0H005_9ROSI|nr:unnamed protein product [Linum tenue]